MEEAVWKHRNSIRRNERSFSHVLSGTIYYMEFYKFQTTKKKPTNQS